MEKPTASAVCVVPAWCLRARPTSPAVTVVLRCALASPAQRREGTVSVDRQRPSCTTETDHKTGQLN